MKGESSRVTGRFFPKCFDMAQGLQGMLEEQKPCPAQTKKRVGRAGFQNHSAGDLRRTERVWALSKKCSSRQGSKQTNRNTKKGLGFAN